MRENTWKREFCDIECCRQEEEVGTWKMPSKFSDEKISGNPQQELPERSPRQKQNTAS